jgi:hypothetical protein
MEIGTATSSVAIVQNSLADRDPRLAIVNVTESLIFPAAGDSRSMPNCFRAAANDRDLKRITSVL